MIASFRRDRAEISEAQRSADSPDRTVIAAAFFLAATLISLLLLWDVWQQPPIDFAPLYLGGKLAAAGRVAHLYDKAAYAPLLPRFFAEGGKPTEWGNYFFIRPAFEAFAYAPFSWLPYRSAALLDGVLNLVAVAVLLWKLPPWYEVPQRLWWRLRGGLLFFYPFYKAVGMGQDTILLTLLLAFALRPAAKQTPVLAGAVLALGMYKPHLLWLVPVILLIEQRWKMVLSWVVASLVLACVSLFAVGAKGLHSWLAILRDPSTDIRPLGMVNLRALGIHFGGTSEAFAAALVVGCTALVLWKGSARPRFAVAILAAILLAPHAYWQDFGLAAVALALTPETLPMLLVLTPWPFLYTRSGAVPMVVCTILWIVFLGAPSLGNTEMMRFIRPHLELFRRTSTG